MPELFELTAFATLLSSTLTTSPQTFNLHLFPHQARTIFITNYEAFTASLGITPFKPLQLTLTQASIRPYGKELYIKINSQWMMVVHFYLHGHAVVMSSAEVDYLWICQANKLPPYAPFLFQAEGSHNSIALVDRNKLLQVEMVQIMDGFTFDTYKPVKRGPCPLLEEGLFRELIMDLGMDGKLARQGSPVAYFIHQHQNYFNGFGGCLTNELLFYARINPLTPTNVVFSKETHSWRLQLLDGWDRLKSIFTSQTYDQYVLSSARVAGKTGTAFHHPLAPLKYRKQITKVYRKTNKSGTTQVPNDLVNLLLDNQQITLPPKPPSYNGRQPRPTKHRQAIPLACYSFKPSPRAPTRYYYSVVTNFPAPPDGILWHELPAGSPAYLAQELIISAREPTIGWTTFFDSQYLIHSEVSTFGRRYPHVNGLPGPPVLTKFIRTRRDGQPVVLNSRIPVKDLPTWIKKNSGNLDLLRRWYSQWAQEHQVDDEGMPQAEVNDEGELADEVALEENCN